MKKRIVHVEDKPEVIEATRFLLKSKEYEVLGAIGGQKGLEVIKQEKPDLVILDLMMPGMDGWEVYKQMKADRNLSNIPVIIYSARSQSTEAERLEMYKYKRDEYLEKGISRQELIEAIERALTDRELEW